MGYLTYAAALAFLVLILEGWHRRKRWLANMGIQQPKYEHSWHKHHACSTAFDIWVDPMTITVWYTKEYLEIIPESPSFKETHLPANWFITY